MDRLACGGVLDSQGFTAVRVAIGLFSHEGIRQGNLHVGRGVDVPAAGTKSSVIMSDIAYACCAGAYTAV